MNSESKDDVECNAQRQTMGEDKVKDITVAAEAPAAEPSTAGKGVDSSSDGQPSAAPPAPPAQGDSDSGKDASSLSSDKNPFDQYYAQLTHQQNMLQDSVRVTAYQRAISENRADFKVRRHREKHGMIILTSYTGSQRLL